MTKPSTSISPAPPWKDPWLGDYSSFLERLSAKDRARMLKHEETPDADGKEHFGELWKRLAARMGKLAPHAAEIQGLDAARFYIPDGKYKQQVFALVQTKEASVVVFLPDVIAFAIERKVLAQSQVASFYGIPGTKNAQMELGLITADTRDMPACKAMLGWGRRALRVELREFDDDDKVRVVERLCELASEKWASSAAVSPAP